MERYVALKVLPRHFASDPQFVSRFKQEAKVLAQLQHPHILPVFDFGEADSYTYLAMPFVKSGALTDLLKGEPLPVEQIGTIVAQVGSALDYAHAHGYIHRDVKPSNVLIDESGNCLLSDFGLAKILEGSEKLTTSGAIMGTPAYMSPEQGMGKPLDGRSDIYSLSVILYEMATGRPPYKAETPMAVMIKHITDPLPPPRSVNPAVPEGLERVILKGMAKDPDDRYQAAGVLARAVADRPEHSTPVQDGPAVLEAPIASPAMGTAPKIAPALPVPLSTVNPPTALGQGFTWRWMVANGIGGCLGLSLMGLVVELGIFMIGGANLVGWPPLAAFVVVVGVGAGLFGAAVGLAQ